MEKEKSKKSKDHDKFSFNKFSFNKFSGVKKNRLLVLVVSLLFVFNYLTFCYHTGSNPFDIFPSFPVLDDKKVINVYLPDMNGKNIYKETRRVPVLSSDEGFVKILTDIVVMGSIYENTSLAVPVSIRIRKVWLHDGKCIIDFGLAVLNEDISVIPGSESTFKKALEKTIMENIPSINRVIFLESGNPSNNIWETGV